MNLKEHALNRITFTIFILSIIVFNIGAITGKGRIWAFNYWSFWAYPLLLFISVCLIILAWILLKRANTASRKKQKSKKKQDEKNDYWLWISMLAAIFILVFVLLRTQLHFLGDGYQLLSILSSDVPVIKPRNYLGTMPQYWIYQLLNGTSWRDALLSYRIISITAGIISLSILAVSINFLFQKNQDRLLAFVGVVSCGTTLLFFGYVENYALFNTIVLAFCLTGMLAAENRIGKFWPIPLVVVSIFFHYFGAVLIPAAVYLLLCDTRFGIKISRMPKIARSVTTIFIIILAIATIIWLYKNNYTFRFALVPFIEDQFTLEGYTLLSPAHLIDYFNMLFLLIPGLLIAIAGLSVGKFELNGPKQRTMFLLIATITSLSSIFLVDPKLGMVRDWDLFAFAGFPLTLLVIDIYLRRKSFKPNARLTIKMIAILGVFILISRAVSLTDPKSAIGLLENNMHQDLLRYSNLGYIIDQYVNWGGDRSHIFTILTEHREKFSELMENKAMEDFKANRFTEAAKGFERQIKLHPQRAFSYAHLGRCQMQAGLFDSAITLLEIAHGLDNYSLSAIEDLGVCYATQGDIKKAKKFFHKSLSLKKDNYKALVNLTKMYLSASDIKKSLEYYNRLSDQDEVSSTYFYSVGQDFESRGYRQYALQAFREAIDRGVPEIVEEKLKSKYPELEH